MCPDVSLPTDTVDAVQDDFKASDETLNSTSRHGSVHSGALNSYYNVGVPRTPRSPTISCDSPYTKPRFESNTDSDGSRSDINPYQSYQPRHYTYSHSPGPAGNIPPPLNLQHNVSYTQCMYILLT